MVATSHAALLADARAAPLRDCRLLLEFCEKLGVEAYARARPMAGDLQADLGTVLRCDATTCYVGGHFTCVTQRLITAAGCFG